MAEWLANDKGFTLVELMVVVLIIGIIVAIAVPTFSAAKTSTEQKTCFSNERTLEGVFQSWQAAGGDASTVTDWNSAMAALVPNYFNSEPVCPSSGSYVAAVSGPVLTVTCTKHAHY